MFAQKKMILKLTFLTALVLCHVSYCLHLQGGPGNQRELSLAPLDDEGPMSSDVPDVQSDSSSLENDQDDNDSDETDAANNDDIPITTAEEPEGADISTPTTTDEAAQEEVPPVASVPLPPVGSLPPMKPVSSSPPRVRTEMLPSTENIVTHKAHKAEENPHYRPMCQTIIDHIGTSASNKNSQSSTFKSFKVMVTLLQMEPTPIADKHCANALSGIHTQVQTGYNLDWNYQLSLRNCAIDDLGRTIFMKIVERGLSQTLANEQCHKLVGIGLNEMRDKEYNNLLHLAAMSGSVEIVQQVVQKLGNHLLELLQKLNLKKEKAIDIAAANGNADIVAYLKKVYLTAKQDAENKKILDDLLASAEARKAAAAANPSQNQ